MKRKSVKTAAGKCAAEQKEMNRQYLRLKGREEAAPAVQSRYQMTQPTRPGSELFLSPAGEFFMEHSVTLLDGKLLPPMSRRLEPLMGREEEKIDERARRMRVKTTVTKMDARQALRWILETCVMDDRARKQFLRALKGEHDITLDITPYQWAALRKCAKLEGRTVDAVVSECINNGDAFDYPETKKR